MNKSYEVIDNKVIVYDQFYHASSRKYTNNIEEVLITENNIEKINELIENEEYYIINRSPIESISPAWFGFGISQIILSINNFINTNIGRAIGYIFTSILFFGGAYFSGIRPAIKRKKIKKRKISFLEEKLEEEEKKLNDLNKDKTNDLMFVDEKERTISRDYKIDVLKDRLRDIKLYIEHKHKIIKLYKKGLLENELFEACASRDTINFIIELVKNDLNAENKSKKNKVKVKANDIEYGNI